jgi:hypothetical protein
MKQEHIENIMKYVQSIQGFIKRHTLVIVLIVLIVVAYINFYITPSKEIEIIQMKVNALDLSHLLEKKPIVLYERLVNPLGLLNTVFKYISIRNKPWIIYNKEYSPFMQNTRRFNVVYAANDCQIQLVHPNLFSKGYPSDVVYMQLKKYQTVIIPMFWWYSIKGHAFSIEIDTIFSIMYRILTLSK